MGSCRYEVAESELHLKLSLEFRIATDFLAETLNDLSLKGLLQNIYFNGGF